VDLVFLAGFAWFGFWVPSVEGCGFGAAADCCLFLVRGGRLRMGAAVFVQVGVKVFCFTDLVFLGSGRRLFTVKFGKQR
jgi:hypothetical protein